MSFEALDVALLIVKAMKPLVEKVRLKDKDLAEQMKQAMFSIGGNLREGARRLGGDRVYHYSVADGSAGELQTHLLNAIAMDYVSGDESKDALGLIDRELAMGWRLTHPKGADSSVATGSRARGREVPARARRR